MQLGLGTVQFGMDYGISNPNGKTPRETVTRILEYANANHICVLDTAHSYGESETVIGETIRQPNPFRVVTKTPAFSEAVITQRNGAVLRMAFAESLRHLRCDSVDALLIHRSSDLLKDGNDILYREMAKLKDQGLVKKIGVSAYDPAQVEQLLQRYNFDIIQVPVNIFDQRMIQSGVLRLLKKRGTEIHARSVFLQGLVFMEGAQLPAHLKPLNAVMARFHRFLEANALSPLDGTLAFIKMVSEVDCVLVGVNDLAQLIRAVRAFESKARLTLTDFSDFAVTDPQLINPSLWPVAA